MSEKTVRLSDCINDFILHCRYEKNLSPKTINAYSIDLEQFQSFINKQKGNPAICSVSKELIKTYLQSVYHFKPKTVKRKIASLKAMFNYLEYENDDFFNPFRKIKIKLKETKTLPTVMTIGEVKKILSLLYEDLNGNSKPDCYTYKAQIRNIAMIELLFATGLRISELCNLKTTDIDLKTGSIKVLGKGSKERIIQLCNPDIKSLLKKYKKLYADHIEDEQNFFINRIGKPVSTQSVRLMLRQYVQRAGIAKKITPHSFRHTFATLLLEENVDIRYIQGMLGHSSINTTQIYTHINTESQKRILTTKHPRRKLKFEVFE
ncbi:MAG: tyrosine-type recombinase/integrase [Bacteroidales bacterium]|nr:tyrosine-type recombinase/integrase [Bacteroidales bacterium]